MYFVIICIALLSVTPDIAQGTLTRLPKGITLHKGKVTWDEARHQCEREGGVVASPITDTVFSAMKAVIGDHNITYFIGTKAIDLPGQFFSTEGVSIGNMPLAVTLDMVQELDQWEGECLAMNRDSIRSVSCESRRPFMCYNEHTFNMNKTNCGLPEDGYKYDQSTGHCYKLHTLPRIWDQAHGECDSEGGHLVIIEDAEEAQILKNMDDFTHNEYIYIGLRRYFFKRGWISIRAQPVEELYNIWVNRVPRTNIDYQCGALHKSGKLQNVHCGTILRYVCQKEPTI